MSIFSLNYFVKIDERSEEQPKEIFSMNSIVISEVDNNYSEVIKIDGSSELNETIQYIIPVIDRLGSINERIENSRYLYETYEGIEKISNDISYINKKISTQKTFIRESELKSLNDDKASLLEFLEDKYMDMKYSKIDYDIDTTIIDESAILLSMKEYVSIQETMDNISNIEYFVSNAAAKHVGIFENAVLDTLEDIREEFSNLL